ncbi:MAG: hypothetical protein K0Q79_925 [Flavipsychrobacter sp.]|nr:hypothetical protein [Flavipsychrobacter sp.]
MKRVLLLVLIFPFSVFGQTIEELEEAWASKSYAEVLEMAVKMKDVPESAAIANEIIGRIFVNTGKYDSAIPYLQKALLLDKDSTSISGWSHAFLGHAYIKTGKKEQGLSELNKAIALHKTDNSVSYAKKKLDAATIEPKWITIESRNIIYKFQDTTLWYQDIREYILEHDLAYIKLSTAFQTMLPQKMTMYVWSDNAIAKKVLGKDLGFASPAIYTCNAHYNQTIGHEMTHILSYWGWSTAPKNTSRFINEGVAVAFDQTRRDKYEMAKNAINGKKVRSVLDVWKDDQSQDELLLYPLAGAFVTYLYAISTPEQFKSIIKDQTIENAEKTYGKVRLGEMIKEFNSKIGLQEAN